jgi:hypothetical protein
VRARATSLNGEGCEWGRGTWRRVSVGFHKTLNSSD